MDKETLHKVQFTQLEIAKEIAKVCEKNGIKVFLDSGSLLGAIRHKGFIPWDDDLDMGMLREDYDKFCAIADKELGEKYHLQTWDNDCNYALPLGKVRKVGTVYVESRAGRSKENGIYVDILPYDFAPNRAFDRVLFRRQLVVLYAGILLKCGYKPWIVQGKVDRKVHLHFAIYKLITLFISRDALIKKYKNIIASPQDRNYVYEQTCNKYYPIEWFDDIIKVPFEDTYMPVISKYHEWLTTAYGDYMTPPPEEERENRHEILEVSFGEAAPGNDYVREELKSVCQK